jgi:hypothetical protein
MNSVLSSTRSWLSIGQPKPSDAATLVPDDRSVSIVPRSNAFLIKLLSLDKRISLAIALVITFCSGVAAALAWQSSRQVTFVAQSAPAPVVLPPAQTEQIEAMSSGLAAVRQSIDELASSLGQMRLDITNLRTTEQTLVDKLSDSPPRPAAAAAPGPRSTPRPSQAPLPVR